ncbi:MFS transporter [Rhodococcus sp. 06-156-3C]|nr:MFS transporter [Rhodococcus sp. 06-156-4a]OZD17970.1 MFS transporter [Rhodococcus sp. 06-156-3C]OZD20694.1 MFS transporter [Rhodococcus sp. 06-156-4C]OZD30587.1 MFS transporter [Rhodococcus sp. 06-156-3b]OZD32640.1 MFS transporter [Rhodococcus sp. 06-156-3]OZF64949.1 MFS transporter [Rhodococcus sp. 06-156-4]
MTADTSISCCELCYIRISELNLAYTNYVPGAHVSRDNSADAIRIRRVRSAVVIGTALEWFDFFLFASMAALVFGRLFFPAFDPATATLASVATFGVGFIARPFGGIVFGALGDRLGRKRVLMMSFVVMGVATGCIGLLPTYETIGVAAPILLVVLRLMQGLGAGAEFSPATAVATEHATAGRRGRQGSWPSLGTNLGLLVSSITVAVLTSASDEFLFDWGWRLPFLASFALLGVGVYVRRVMPETPEFVASVKAQPDVHKSSFRTLIKDHKRGLLAAFLVMLGSTAASYLFKTFSLAYMTTYRGVEANVGATGVAIATAVAVVVVPLAGMMCDRFGTNNVLRSGGIIVALAAFPFFWLLNTGNALWIWLALVVTTGIAMPLMTAAQGSFFSAQFPVEIRTSGIGLSRETAGAVAGGLAPVLALGLVQSSPTNATWGVSAIFVLAAVSIVYGSVRSVRHTGAVDRGEEEREPMSSEPGTFPTAFTK